MLNEKDPTCETPKNFNGELMIHQKTALASMLEIEKKRYYRVDSNQIIETSAGILSEEVGSGKTIEILALLTKSLSPRVLPQMITFPTMIRSRNVICYRKFKRSIRSNVIIVGSSVTHQWMDAIRNFTQLRVFLVDSSESLKKYFQLVTSYENGTSRIVNDYDIVVLRNGVTSANWVIKLTKSTSIIEIFREITMRFTFSRVIIDDFDLIKITQSTTLPNAFFTWFVSATMKFNRVLQNDIYKKIENFNDHSATFINAIYLDKYLKVFFKVQCAPEYIKKSVILPAPKYYSYMFKNPFMDCVGYLEVMADDKTIAIVDMLNASAIDSAAKMAGIIATSPVEIFEKILGDKILKIRKYQAIIDNIYFAINFLQNVPWCEYSGPEITIIKNQVIQLNDDFHSYIPGKSAPLIKLLNDIQIDLSGKKAINERMIDRVKGNMRDNECPVCQCMIKSMDEDMNMVIMKCCGIVLCEECAINSSAFTKKLRGICPNCKTSINFHQNMIYVDLANLDISDIVQTDVSIKNTNVIEDAPEDVPEDVPEIADEIADEIENRYNGIVNNKLRAVMQIINEEPVAEGVEPKIEYDGQHHNKKVIIFAGFSETVRKIAEMLDKFHIKFDTLQGTAKQMDEAVGHFKSTSQVILINSSKHCAGLNLQFVSDVIYFHKIFDYDIEAQVSGRAQRIGRDSELSVHYLQYENESTMNRRVDN
ncbi:MAG: hypothetical protein KAS12_04030 [Candidatus Aenigmarchaeota archaeon]|nr:hypothetical protein [Candidatus Aenigmarchaeota archaeon]